MPQAGSSIVDTSKPGAQNVGKGDGSQFITGQCFSNADCASNCCNKNTGLCNAIGAVGADACGFQASNSAASPTDTTGTTGSDTSSANPAIDTSKPGSQNVGKGDGSQFITGQCLTNADCASTCCNKNTGVCNAIGAVGIENCQAGAGGQAATPATPPATDNTSTDTSSANPAIDSSKPGAQNVGKGDGSQFITGQCFTNADCASTCCNKDTGVCNAIGAVGIENCQAGAGSPTSAAPSESPAADNGNTANPAIDTSKPGSQNVGKGDGSQFITGQCLTNADCASTCCNKNTGVCNAIGAVGIENCQPGAGPARRQVKWNV
jgi:hypothetical protein